MLAIICGSGEYPLGVAQRCVDLNENFVLVFLSGIADLSYNWPSVTSSYVSLGEVGKLLEFCKKNSVDKVVMAGAVKRPNILDISFDSEGKKWLLKAGMKIFLGDDGLLRAIGALFEENGMEIISGKNFLESAEDINTKIQPSEQDLFDMKKGISVLKALGNEDVGQAVIVENGIVLGIEGVEGTDNLIKRIKQLKKTEKGGVLVKMAKASQDLRLDLPTIGIKTLENVHASALNGIAFEKGKCIVLNRSELIKFADENNLFIKEL